MRKFSIFVAVLALVGLVFLPRFWPVHKKRTHLVFVGDSLTFGLGVESDQSMPALIDLALKADGYPYQVVNGGISGSAIRSAVPRIAHWIRQPLDIAVFVIALGGMDSKRTDYDKIEQELSEAVEAALKHQSQVLLVAFHAPVQYLGAGHSERFAQVYSDVAKKFRVPLVPNQLAGIEGRPELYQADLEHPNAIGMKRMAQTIYPELRKLLYR